MGYGIDLVDETFLAVPPASVAPVVADPARWRRWWPDQHLTVFLDRGEKGIRWSVSGAVVGSSEIWLEEFRDGTILHYFLRADPTQRGTANVAEPIGDSPAQQRRAARLRSDAATSWKRHVWALKDELEAVHRGGPLPDHDAGS